MNTETYGNVRLLVEEKENGFSVRIEKGEKTYRPSQVRGSMRQLDKFWREGDGKDVPLVALHRLRENLVRECEPADIHFSEGVELSDLPVMVIAKYRRGQV